MICRIINVEVRVISRAKGVADNSYLDIDHFAYQKTSSNNCFIIDFKAKIIMARKTIKNNQHADNLFIC